MKDFYKRDISGNARYHPCNDRYICSIEILIIYFLGLVENTLYIVKIDAMKPLDWKDLHILSIDRVDRSDDSHMFLGVMSVVTMLCSLRYELFSKWVDYFRISLQVVPNH